jgi:MoxR-like ATPase
VIAVYSADTSVRFFEEQFELLVRHIGGFVIGKREAVRLALICLFAEGHLLIEDVPGVAKTSLAKAIACSIGGGTVKRIQFTSDLLPADITGVEVYNQRTGDFYFRKGPVFTNVLLADEINRAAPKTQSALLEVMAERQVTIDGDPYRLDPPFLCIATQNPIEHHGTFALPEAQIDRFMMMISLGYPERQAEAAVVEQGIARRRPEALEAVISFSDINEMIMVARNVHVARSVMDYVVDLVRGTRSEPEAIRLGASPRASVALAQAAQAHAASQGRGSVYEADVQAVMLPVLRHRLVLTPDAELRGIDVDKLLAEIREKVPTPTARAR